ncbi:DcrB-related protein [bacterium]|nr:DcrB-related protein [bacterium]
MYKVLIASLLLTAGLFGSGCSRPAVAPSSTPTGQTSQADKPFVLPAPSGWKASDKLGSGVAQLYMGPDQGGFQANINVMVQTLPGNMDLKSYTDVTLKQMEAAKAKIVSEQDVTVSGVPAHQVVWTATMNGRNLQFLSQYALKDGKAILFTGTSLEAKYSEVSPVFESSAASMQLK